MSKNQGQSTIEFLIVSVFATGILGIFIQLAFNLAEGFLVHYATYMASRTFMVYDQISINQVAADYAIHAPNQAKKVFASYLPSHKTTALKFNNYDTDAPKDYFLTGAYYQYSRPVSLFSYLGGGVNNTMRSESFLGKEPTRGECWERTKKAMEKAVTTNEFKKYTTVFDNGC